MLSAVAARKARLAQAPPPSIATPTTPRSPSPLVSTRASDNSAPPPHPKPSSKRKPSSSAGNPPKKKSGPRKSPAERSARYFAQPQPDTFKTQEDVIVVDASDDESSLSSSDTSSDSPALPAHNVPSATRRPRAYSPSAPVADSSDEEGDEVDVIVDVSVPPPSDSVAPLAAPLSTFKPLLNQSVYHLTPSDQKRTVLLLSATETVALVGTYTLTVLSGSVTLAGATLTSGPASYPVYAPRSSPIPLITCLPLRSTSNSHPPPGFPSHVADACQGYDAAIVLQESHTGIEGLGRICRTFDGCFAPSRWHRSQVHHDLGLDTVCFLSKHTPDISPLVVPKSWDAAFARTLPTETEENDISAREAVFLVRGHRNAGKSTFARLLINRLLSRFRRVAYMECDLGQSEFAPSGLVSLNVVEQPIFGPPFSHQSVPYSSHYVGATSPRNSPSHYMDCIQALVQTYNLDLRNGTSEDADEASDDGPISSMIPLVVNTMGWTKGLGADLGHKVEETVEPSHVFSFEVAPFDDDWSSPGQPHSQASSDPGTPRIHVVESVSPSSLSSHYTAADHRNLSILSYFHATLSYDPSTADFSSPLSTRWNTSLPLCAQPPYEVDCRTAFSSIVLTGAGMEDVVPAELPRALNGAIVALVSCDPGTMDDVPSIVSSDARNGEGSSLRYEQGAPPPSPHTSRCLGLALVRGISRSEPTKMQLITPVPPSLLASARVLVMGELQLPVWGMLDFRTLDDGGDIAGYERGKVPFLRWGRGEGAGGERRRVRRNLMRRGQM